MITNSASNKTYRVLCLEGGGMRGIYSATYLNNLSNQYAKKLGLSSTDIGSAFDLIVGTSTGAILAAGLAKGVDLKKIIGLFETKGIDIFPEKIPSSTVGIMLQMHKRSKLNKNGAKALQSALENELGKTTIGEIWSQRKIGLAITAVEMTRMRSWVFKTPHLSNSKHRDDNYTLAQACMASTAAPVFRSLASIETPDEDEHKVFVDGGLWANNPVLVGLTDALLCTNKGDKIEIYCLGTSPAPDGQLIAKDDVDWGYNKWNMGSKAAEVSLAAQQYAFDNIARMFAGQITDKVITIDRFPSGCIIPDLLPYLRLDETSPAGLSALKRQANTDVSDALSLFGDQQSDTGKRFNALFMSMGPKIGQAD